MKKEELVSAVASKVEMSKACVQKVYDEIFCLFAEELVKGEQVVVNGFGTFKVAERKARVGKNPRTGESIKIPASKAVTFKVSSNLKNRVNK